MSKLADTLFHIQKKSGMYFGHSASIHEISAFITGFNIGQVSPTDSLSFEYFTRWVAGHYRVADGPKGAFSLILERVGGDEHLTSDEFFRLLPSYVRDMAELGGDGIHAHYGNVMREIHPEK